MPVKPKSKRKYLREKLDEVVDLVKERYPNHVGQSFEIERVGDRLVIKKIPRTN